VDLSEIGSHVFQLVAVFKIDPPTLDNDVGRSAQVELNFSSSATERSTQMRLENIETLSRIHYVEKGDKAAGYVPPLWWLNRK